MSDRPGFRFLNVFILFAALFLSPVSQAQTASEENKGIDSGDYNIHQSIEAGYRENWVNGDQATYNTFINLGQGFRLFDYTLDMRSLDHNGLLFDTLSFSNFGYGGDPDTVSRLRIEKNKVYDFRVLFRRSKFNWDWNLLANPLNPASSTPAVPITNSPHALDTVRRLQDYDLTLFPQSKIRFRLGYSRNRETGPAGYTTNTSDDGAGNPPQLNEQLSYTTNAYRAGVDFRVLPRTTISYDQLLNYFKQDNVITDNALLNGTTPFVLPNGTPVDLGLVWDTVNGLPCAAPILTAPNAVNPNCDGTLSYSQVGRPRNFMPTERLRFQSNYFKDFETSGSFGYSSSDNAINDFNEIATGWTGRTISRGSTTAGPAEAKRVSVNANWSGAYAVTDKFRIVDEFRYDNWRIPGTWAFDETTSLPPVPDCFLPSRPSLERASPSRPPVRTTIPAPPRIFYGDLVYISGPEPEIRIRFQLQYDFNRRLSGRIGYLYTSRTIAEFDTPRISRRKLTSRRSQRAATARSLPPARQGRPWFAAIFS